MSLIASITALVTALQAIPAAVSTAQASLQGFITFLDANI